MNIPRQFHRIWLGKKPMPDNFIKWGIEWKLNHPGWTLTDWTESNLNNIKLTNSDLLPFCQSFAEASDIIRYDLIYQFGGVYIDTDFECYKNIEPLIQNCDFFVCGRKDNLSVQAILGGIPKNNFCNYLNNNLRESFFNNITKTTVERTGPVYLFKCADECPSDVLELNYNLFYPTESKIIIKSDYPNAYGAHHWSGSWIDS